MHRSFLVFFPEQGLPDGFIFFELGPDLVVFLLCGKAYWLGVGGFDP